MQVHLKYFIEIMCLTCDEKLKLLSMDLHFTTEELTFCSSSYPMVLREDILKKVSQLFEHTRQELLLCIKQQSIFPEGSDLITGKISKGERYRGMPWMVLDFPRYNVGSEIMLYRVFFLWAEGFRFVLHLSGKDTITRFKPLIKEQMPIDKGIEIAFTGLQWQHHQELDYFKTYNSDTNLPESASFIKLSKHLPLTSGLELPMGARQFLMELNSCLGIK